MLKIATCWTSVSHETVIICHRGRAKPCFSMEYNWAGNCIQPLGTVFYAPPQGTTIYVTQSQIFSAMACSLAVGVNCFRVRRWHRDGGWHYWRHHRYSVPVPQFHDTVLL